MISAGFWLGRIAWVREHLQWLTLLIVFISVLPVVVTLWLREGRPRRRRMRVLLVEDDRMIGEAIVRALREAAYAADWVRDGTRAVAAVSR